MGRQRGARQVRGTGWEELDGGTAVGRSPAALGGRQVLDVRTAHV